MNNYTNTTFYFPSFDIPTMEEAAKEIALKKVGEPCRGMPKEFFNFGYDPRTN